MSVFEKLAKARDDLRGHPLARAPHVVFTSDTFRAETGIGAPSVTAQAAALAASSTTVHTGGPTFVLLFDAAASANSTAATNFRAGIVQAASIISSALSDPITISINVNYSGTGGGASAGPNYAITSTYAAASAALRAHATPGDTTFAAMPSSITGATRVDLFLPEAKALGLYTANDTSRVDGAANFATDIAANAIVGV